MPNFGQCWPTSVCNPYVMTDSPDVLSTGRWCIDQGYDFHWPAHDSKPLFITPLGKTLTLEVGHYVLFLRIDAKPTAAATKPTTPVGHDRKKQDSPTMADVDIERRGWSLVVERSAVERIAPAPSPYVADESDNVGQPNADESRRPNVGQAVAADWSNLGPSVGELVRKPRGGPIAANIG